LQRWDAARLSFGRGLRLNPPLVEARIALSAGLMHLNGAEEALALFSQAVDVPPGKRSAWQSHHPANALPFGHCFERFTKVL
jgi:hypothetical protein